MSFRQDLIWRLEGLGFAGFIGFMRLLGVERASALGGWLLRTLGPRRARSQAPKFDAVSTGRARIRPE